MPPNNIRKEPCGEDKWKKRKKKKDEELVKSQENDLFRYFKKPETLDESAENSDKQHSKDDGGDENLSGFQREEKIPEPENMSEYSKEETILEAENVNAVNEEDLNEKRRWR